MPASDHVERTTGDDPVPPSPRLPLPQLVLVGVLLGAPLVGLMWVSSYAREEPRLGGMPFFYWYQFMWVLIAAATTSLAYQVVIRHERRRRAHHAGTRPDRTDRTGGDAR